MWCVLLLIASLNGTFREAVLIPRTGDVLGRIISTLLLSLFIIILAWLTISWIGPRSVREAWLVGIAWLLLTIAFEFLAGRCLFAQPVGTVAGGPQRVSRTHLGAHAPHDGGRAAHLRRLAECTARALIEDGPHDAAQHSA
jgi:hypothetical protein